MATYTIKPRSGNDDVRYRDGAGFQSASETLGRIGYFDGTPAGKTQMVFYVHTIPAGSTIIDAYLSLIVKAKPSGTGKSFVSGVVNEALSITVNWTCNVSGMTVGGTITTPDIKSIVQDIVDTEGYDPEVGAGFWVGWGDAAKGEYFDCEVYDGTEGENAWEIEVTTEDDPIPATIASTAAAATSLCVGRSYTTGTAEIASTAGVAQTRVRGIVTSPTIDATIDSEAPAATSAVRGLVNIVATIAAIAPAATSAASAERTGPIIDATIDSEAVAVTTALSSVQDVVVRIASTAAAATSATLATRTGPTIDVTIDAVAPVAESSASALIPAIAIIASTAAAATTAVSAERTGPTIDATIAAVAPVVTSTVAGSVEYPPIGAHDVDAVAPAATSAVMAECLVHTEVPGSAWWIEVHSKTGGTIAWLPLAQNGEFTLRLNATSTLSFDYPAGRDEAEHLERPYQVFLYDNFSRLVQRFRILNWSDKREGNNLLRHVECECLLGQLLDEHVTEYTATDKTVAEIVDELLALQANTTPIQLGKIDDAIGDLVRTVTIRDMSLLAAINEVYDLVQDGYFWVRPVERVFEWRDRVNRNQGQALHYRKQMRGMVRTYNTSKLVNRLYVYGNGNDSDTRINLIDAGEAAEYIEDASSQGDYGIVAASMTWPTVENAATLLELAELYLETYATPYIAYDVDSVWLPALGGQFDYDRLQIGAPVVVIDDSLGIAVNTHVVEMSGSLVDPFNMRVTLANKGQNFFQYLASLEKRLRALETAENPVPVVVADVTVAGALPPTLREGEFVYDKATGLPGFIGADGLWYPMTGDSENETFITNVNEIINNYLIENEIEPGLNTNAYIWIAADLTAVDALPGGEGYPEAIEAQHFAFTTNTKYFYRRNADNDAWVLDRPAFLWEANDYSALEDLPGTAGFPDAPRRGDHAVLADGTHYMYGPLADEWVLQPVFKYEDGIGYMWDGSVWQPFTHYAPGA